MDEKRLHVFLEEKKELVFQLLRMTNDAEFNEADNDANAEKFIALVDARQDIIDRLKEIENSIDKEFTKTGTKPFDKEIKSMIGQISKLEAKIDEKSLEIMTKLQDDIKKLNERKKASKVYDSVMF